MKATWSDRRWRRPAEARMFWAWRVRLLSLCPPTFDFLLSNTLVIHIIKVGFARYPRTLPSDTVSSSLAALKARNQDSALPSTRACDRRQSLASCNEGAIAYGAFEDTNKME
jgi:hypothetical protein